MTGIPNNNINMIKPKYLSSYGIGLSLSGEIVIPIHTIDKLHKIKVNIVDITF
jgi:hypothetical protein